MKKLTIADIKATEILSKDERKMVVGGSGIGGGTLQCGNKQEVTCNISTAYTTSEGQQTYRSTCTTCIGPGEDVYQLCGCNASGVIFCSC